MYNQTNPNRPTSSTTYTSQSISSTQSISQPLTRSRQLFPFPPPPAVVYSPSPPRTFIHLSVHIPLQTFFSSSTVGGRHLERAAAKGGGEAVDLRSSQMNETDVGGVQVVRAIGGIVRSRDLATIHVGSHELDRSQLFLGRIGGISVRCAATIFYVYTRTMLSSLSFSLFSSLSLCVVATCPTVSVRSCGSTARGTRPLCSSLETGAGSFRRYSISKSTYRVTKYISVRVRAQKIAENVAMNAQSGGETGRDGERHDDSPSMIVKLLEREGSTRVEMMRLTRFLTLESLVFGSCSESFFLKGDG